MGNSLTSVFTVLLTIIFMFLFRYKASIKNVERKKGRSTDMIWSLLEICYLHIAHPGEKKVLGSVLLQQVFHHFMLYRSGQHLHIASIITKCTFLLLFNTGLWQEYSGQAVCQQSRLQCGACHAISGKLHIEVCPSIIDFEGMKGLNW